ncbi:retrotransposon gag domain-containing protein, partial [Alteromonas stellipolaris]
MFRILNLSENATKLRFIPFALKDKAKKWLNWLPNNSIGTWTEFIEIFLKKFFPMNKTARIRQEINRFRQQTGEPFWKYLERFKDLLTQCPHHAIYKWRLCQILYEGAELQT